jgi:hypothetical protein
MRAAEPSKSVGSRKGNGKGALARYNMTRVDFKTFTFSTGSKSRSIDNAVLGPLPKRLLLTMIKDSDFNGLVDRNPYKFRLYDISDQSEAHTSLPENGNITIELQFSQPLPEAITCLLYLESTVLST